MANDLIVITGASTEDHGTLSLYRQQLSNAGIDFHLRDSSDIRNYGGGNLQFRIMCFRQLSQQFSSYRYIVFTDAFDVTFFGTKEAVIQNIPTTHILHGAEKNCYPDPSISPIIEKNTPWCFANGGLAAGTPENFLKWCDFAESHPLYNPYMLDQGFLNILLSMKSPMALIDDQTTLFYCLFGGYDELSFIRGRPWNVAYGTTPSFLHANGKWDATDMFRRQKESL